MAYNVNIMKEQKTATPNRRKDDEDFKQSALNMIDNGQSVRSVAHALGIAESLLHRWKKAARGHDSPTVQEVFELRPRLKHVEMERDILKKALSIFSRQT